MAERIGEAAGAVAVEFVFEGMEHPCPGRNGFVEDGINVWNINVNHDRRATDGLRAESAHGCNFVGQHDGRAIDGDFGVADGAIWARESKAFNGIEDIFIEFDSLSGAFYKEVRGYRMITVRNRFERCRHDKIPFLLRVARREDFAKRFLYEGRRPEANYNPPIHDTRRSGGDAYVRPWGTYARDS